MPDLVIPLSQETIAGLGRVKNRIFLVLMCWKVWSWDTNPDLSKYSLLISMHLGELEIGQQRALGCFSSLVNVPHEIYFSWYLRMTLCWESHLETSVKPVTSFSTTIHCCGERMKTLSSSLRQEWKSLLANRVYGHGFFQRAVEIKRKGTETEGISAGQLFLEDQSLPTPQ